MKQISRLHLQIDRLCNPQSKEGYVAWIEAIRDGQTGSIVWFAKSDSSKPSIGTFSTEEEAAQAIEADWQREAGNNAYAYQNIEENSVILIDDVLLQTEEDNKVESA